MNFSIAQDESPKTSPKLELNTLWDELQQAEIMLVQTSLKKFSEKRSQLFSVIIFDRKLLSPSYVSATDLSAETSLKKYPFSEYDLIQANLDSLSNAGLVLKRDGVYRLLSMGKEILDNYVISISDIISSLPLKSLTKEEKNMVVQIDNDILQCLMTNLNSENNELLLARVNGVQTNYDTP